MSNGTHNLKFLGYWRAVNARFIPNDSGIYCVYTCKTNHEENTVLLDKLIYIGESDNVRERIYDHERLADWMSQLNQGQELCFSFAPIDSSQVEVRKMIEEALIFQLKPKCNVDSPINKPQNGIQQILSSGANFAVGPAIQF